MDDTSGPGFPGPFDRVDDVFMRAYLSGMPGPLDDAAPKGPPRAAPSDPLALGGQIITGDGPVRGWVTVENGTVTAIGPRKPAGARAVATAGVILPGLIDLHGHPEFNVFAPWEPPKAYLNRYAWRASDPYHVLIRDPQDKLATALPTGTQLRYAEIRALVGGVTAIQGASQNAQRNKTESLVRNVDGIVFGEHRARSLIDLPSSLDSQAGEDLTNILTAIGRGDVDAFYIHLAEGMRDNQRSMDEFDELAGFSALTSATVIIHGTALSRAQLGAAADAGAKLVWSPQSNLRLYGETTRAADALDVGLPLALGADWLPSGSTSLLAEMKVARQELLNQGRATAAKDLVTMVTAGAAEISGLGARLGTVEVGRTADLTVLARRDLDPYESVCAAFPNDVELVLIGGTPVYGRTDWVGALGVDAVASGLEPVVAWGRLMLLDTSYEGAVNDDPVPRLEQLQAALTTTYPPVGPIWA